MVAQLRFTTLAALMFLAAGSAVAADCGVDCITGYSYYPYLPRSVYVQDYIPYFAQHPPVYYSYPVPRPYGYSPYAYPPGTKTPEIVQPEPMVIQNKFVPRKAPSQQARDRVTSVPRRVSNPYVTAPGEPTAPESAVALKKPQSDRLTD